MEMKNVVVVGGGYVGLPLAILARQAGYNVTILDIDEKKVESINNGVRPIDFPDIKISATTDPLCQSNADVVVICVPTPTNKDLTPCLDPINSAIDSFKKYRKSDCLLSIESTVYPGYTDEVVASLEGFDTVVFSPERINPGTPFDSISKITKVVGGPYASTLGKDFYRKLFDSLYITDSFTVAEMTKLLENSFRATNIALVNEFAKACNVLNLDIWEVIHAAESKSFGYMPFYPGPGVGGHCIAIDSYYLIWAMHKYNLDLSLLQSIMDFNKETPSYIASRIKDLVLPNSKILIIGVTYKENVSDIRESPSIDIIAKLQEENYNVYYYDPLINRLDDLEMTSSDLNESFDLGVLTVNHSCLDFGRLLKSCNKIFDLKNTKLSDINTISGKVVRL